MHKRREGLVYGTLTLVLGVGLATLGGAGLTTAVTCHGHKMRPTEKCFTIYRHTGPVLHTPTQEAASQNRQNWLLLGFGLPLAIGGASWLTTSIRPRRPGLEA